MLPSLLRRIRGSRLFPVEDTGQGSMGCCLSTVGQSAGYFPSISYNCTECKPVKRVYTFQKRQLYIVGAVVILEAPPLPVLDIQGNPARK